MIFHSFVSLPEGIVTSAINNSEIIMFTNQLNDLLSRGPHLGWVYVFFHCGMDDQKPYIHRYIYTYNVGPSSYKLVYLVYLVMLSTNLAIVWGPHVVYLFACELLRTSTGAGPKPCHAASSATAWDWSPERLQGQGQGHGKTFFYKANLVHMVN